MSDTDQYDTYIAITDALLKLIAVAILILFDFDVLGFEYSVVALLAIIATTASDIES